MPPSPSDRAKSAVTRAELHFTAVTKSTRTRSFERSASPTMVDTSPQDLPTTQNTSRELRASVETPGDEKNVENRQDSDIKMATSDHVNHPIHKTEFPDLSPTTAISPIKHLQNTPRELPASATYLGVTEMEILHDGEWEMMTSGPAAQAEHQAEIRANTSPTTAVSPLQHLTNKQI